MINRFIKHYKVVNFWAAGLQTIHNWCNCFHSLQHLTYGRRHCKLSGCISLCSAARSHLFVPRTL